MSVNKIKHLNGFACLSAHFYKKIPRKVPNGHLHIGSTGNVTDHSRCSRSSAKIPKPRSTRAIGQFLLNRQIIRKHVLRGLVSHRSI